MSPEGDRLHGEVVSLRDYFERVIADLERSIHLSEETAREAIQKADESLNKRLDLLNEFRQQSADRDALFAPLTRLDAVDNELTKIRTDHVQRTEFNGTNDRLNTIGRLATRAQAIAGICAVLIGASLGYVISLNGNHSVIDHQITILQTQNAQLKQEILAIQSLDRFICRTRAPTLPAC